MTPEERTGRLVVFFAFIIVIAFCVTLAMINTGILREITAMRILLEKSQEDGGIKVQEQSAWLARKDSNLRRLD
jgi:hypothetical protein